MLSTGVELSLQAFSDLCEHAVSRLAHRRHSAKLRKKTQLLLMPTNSLTVLAARLVPPSAPTRALCAAGLSKEGSSTGPCCNQDRQQFKLINGVWEKLQELLHQEVREGHAEEFFPSQSYSGGSNRFSKEPEGWMTKTSLPCHVFLHACSCEKL